MGKKYFILHLSKDNLIYKITFQVKFVKNPLLINYCDILVFTYMHLLRLPYFGTKYHKISKIAYLSFDH